AHFYQDSQSNIGSTQTNLVVSAGTKYSDLKKIYEHFSFLNVDCAIVTKLDETEDIGNVVAFLLETGLPVSYLSVGQNVPKDLELASKEKILDYFIGDLKKG
ncbi:MAG TPA: flagellar biosynthesis protein FlhF, partial [Nitratifractor sp.]|nr:flagellar biosynthesis protein FlhF [Nitratifractor sp.]